MPKTVLFFVFLLHRDGFTSIMGIDGLLTSGRERQMGKAVFTQSMVMFSLATSKKDGDTDTFFVSMLMGQGSIICNVPFNIYFFT